MTRAQTPKPPKARSRLYPVEKLLLVTGLLLFFTGAVGVGNALAHKPSFSDGTYGGAETAYAIENMDTSIVVYHDVTCESPELWMSFDATEPREIFVQLGVPVIDRLRDYAPAVAVVAPGLPAPTEQLPFELPYGMGAVIIYPGPIEEPEGFYEPFSGTSSWILYEGKVALPAAGQGYVVGYHPGRETGKLWVAVGEVEDFGPDDFAQMGTWLNETQRFHEVGSHVPESPIEEQQCSVDDGHDHDGDDHEEQEQGAGCQQAGAGNTQPTWPLLLGLTLLGLLARRQRTRRPGS